MNQSRIQFDNMQNKVVYGNEQLRFEHVYMFWVLSIGVLKCVYWNFDQSFKIYFNPFVPNAPFLYPLKTSEHGKVFWCFQGVEKGYIGTKWVKTSKRFTRYKQNAYWICTKWNILIKRNARTIFSKSRFHCSFSGHLFINQNAYKRHFWNFLWECCYYHYWFWIPLKESRMFLLMNLVLYDVNRLKQFRK